MRCPAPRLAASVLGLLYSNRGVNPSVTAYALPPFPSSTWSPRFVRKAHLRCSLFHWAYYGLFPPLAAAFVRPFFLREKGGFWTGQLHTVVPLSKRLPLEARGAVGVSRLRGSPRKNRKIMQFETQNLQFRINHRPLPTIHLARNPSQFRARFSTSVSYTHLDVYKRQHEGYAQRAQRAGQQNAPFFPRSAALPPRHYASASPAASADSSAGSLVSSEASSSKESVS